MLLGLPATTLADTAYGTLGNFDVVNDTGGTCYGFEIELDDVSSTSVGYTYDWNHYGTPVIRQDSADPAHPKVFIRYGGKKNPDGTFIGFTNPQDPQSPIGATSGHDCTDPSVNRGCEHFGVGYYGAPSAVKYHWLVEDPLAPGSLVLGPAVTVAMPQFVYVPAVPPPILPGDPPAAPARVAVVIEPPEPAEPKPEQFGVPVWVKILKTVQPSGKKVSLDELVTDDETKADDKNWDGDEVAETEIEWTVFQKRPANNPGEDELAAEDELPEGDETVTRRYEFYKYEGEVNPEDGEAKCHDERKCPEAIGAYIGAPMAGFNVETPLGLIDHLQDGEVAQPYVDRLLVVGGNTPYVVGLSAGALPAGLSLDPVTGILNGTPTAAGTFEITVEATDADAVKVTKAYTLVVLEPLAITSVILPNGVETAHYLVTLSASGGVAPYAWSVDALPAGLQLSPDGVLSGVPERGTAGNYQPTFIVTDSLGNTAQLSVGLILDAAPRARGDIDNDGDIDRADLALVLAARNRPAAGPNDPRDLDGDGRITVLDARILINLIPRQARAAQ